MQRFFSAAGFFFLKVLIFDRIWSVVGREMVEGPFQPDSCRQQNNGTWCQKLSRRVFPVFFKSASAAFNKFEAELITIREIREIRVLSSPKILRADREVF